MSKKKLFRNLKVLMKKNIYQEILKQIKKKLNCTSMDFNELLDKLDNLDEKNLKKAKESLGGITKEKMVCLH